MILLTRSAVNRILLVQVVLCLTTVEELDLQGYNYKLDFKDTIVNVFGKKYNSLKEHE